MSRAPPEDLLTTRHGSVKGVRGRLSPACDKPRRLKQLLQYTSPIDALNAATKRSSIHESEPRMDSEELFDRCGRVDCPTTWCSSIGRTTIVTTEGELRVLRVACGRGRNPTVSVSMLGTLRRIALICGGFAMLASHICDSARAGPDSYPGPLTPRLRPASTGALRCHEPQFGTQNRISGDHPRRQIAYRRISASTGPGPLLRDTHWDLYFSGNLRSRSF